MDRYIRNTPFILQAPLRVAYLPAPFVALATICLLVALTRRSKAAPYLGYSPNGYIFKYRSSTTTEVQGSDIILLLLGGFGLLREAGAAFDLSSRRPKPKVRTPAW